MKLDFSAKILGMSGEPLKDSTSTNELTLGSVICNALLVNFPGENLTGEDKVRRFRLAEMAYDGGEQEVADPIIKEIKDAVGKAYGTLIVGRVYKMLDLDLKPSRPHPSVKFNGDPEELNEQSRIK